MHFFIFICSLKFSHGNLVRFIMFKRLKGDVKRCSFKMIDVGAFRENPRPVSFRLNMALTTDKPCLETTRKKMHSELIVFFFCDFVKKN